MSSNTPLRPLDDSTNNPSSTNMMQPFTGGLDLIRRCSTIGSSIPSTFAFVAQKHPLSLDLKKKEEELKFEEELNKWGETQPEENQVKVEIAKQRILACYKNYEYNLDLCNLDLTSVPNSVLQKLGNLRNLYLRDNQLSSFDGTGLGKLTLLDLTGNRLSSFVGTGFTHLDTLYLNDNQLSSFDGTGLGNLETLLLNNNQLSSFVGTGLGNLTNLHLDCNQLSSFDGTGLGNLETLLLNNNQLSSFVGTGLIKLGFLTLSNNQLPSFVGTELTKLRFLDASYNQLSSFDGTGLGNLTSLYLTRNRLSSFVGTGFTHLESLHLSHNRLSSFVGTGLIKLESLHLSHNQLSSFDGTGLIKLGFLTLSDNQTLHQLPMSLGQCTDLVTIDVSCTSIPAFQSNTILASCRALRDSSSASNLPIKLDLWKVFAKVDIDFVFIHSFSKEEIAIIYEWLQRLERSNDFRKNQQNLALVVCNILKDLQNKEFKELALVQMEANNEACQDRAAMALNELFLSWNLCCHSQDLSNTQKLDLIIRAGKTLALRNAIAEQLKGRTDLGESVETYLFYEIKLAKELNLLTCIQNMSYAGCSKVLDEEALKKYVEENFLKEAASIPILDNLLKKSSASIDPVATKTQKDIERSKHYSSKQLELLEEKEPQKQENETEEELKHRYLEWESEMNKIARENKEQILAIKMDYLKTCKI